MKIGATKDCGHGRDPSRARTGRSRNGFESILVFLASFSIKQGTKVLISGGSRGRTSNDTERRTA